MRKCLVALSCLAIYGFAVNTLFPQASISTSEIRGTIYDPSGGVLPGAVVTITDTAQGIRRTTMTNKQGSYVMLALRPSRYELRVELTGFAAYTVSNLQLEVDQALNLPITLSLRDLQEQVWIIAEPDTAEVERSQQSSVISEKQIEHLPINYRNFMDFVLLTPGVADSDNINDLSDSRIAPSIQSGLSFAGNNGRGNSVMIDSVTSDNNTGGMRTVVGQQGVQEFQVNSNSYQAEFGGASGGIINIVSKSGSNDFSGGAFGYFRDETFDARNSFDFSPSKGSPFNRQQYGGYVGGPIMRDHTFFFLSFERMDQVQSSFVNLLNDPKILEVTESQRSLFDFLDRSPFAGVSALLRSALTTTPQLYPATVSLFKNATGQFPFDSSDTNFFARIDHTLNNKDNLFLRFNATDLHRENEAAGALNAVSRGRTRDDLYTGILLSQIHFFSPSTINEFKGQFDYGEDHYIPNDPIGPELQIEGFGNFGREYYLPSLGYGRLVEASDNVSLVRGKHIVKAGGQFNAFLDRSDSSVYFGGRFNFANAIPLASIIAGNQALGPQLLLQMSDYMLKSGSSLAVDGNGNHLADSLDAPINSLQSFNLNLPIMYQQGFGNGNCNLNAYGTSFYVQDSWKPTANLTLNVGLRYYIENDKDPVPTAMNNLQPRFGLSWDPGSNGKTVIRGGYGVFAGRIDNHIVYVVNKMNGTNTPGNINTMLALANSDQIGLPTSFDIYQILLRQGIIGTRTIAAADLAQFGLEPGPGRPLEVRFRLAPNYRNPYTQQASFGVQRSLGGGYSLEASYLFSRGLHIPRSRDSNPFKQTGPTNPYSGVPEFIRFPNKAGQTSDFRNPLILQDNTYESTANSFYHAGVLRLLKRYSRGFSIDAHYTYSKAIDDVTDYNTDFSAQNPLNTRLDRSLSAFHQQHRFIFNGIYETPMKGNSRWGGLLQNWIVSTIFSARSGRPFNLLLGFDANNDARSQTDRPNRAGRNTGHGEAMCAANLRLTRRIRLKESRRLDFTFEAFNLFNRTNYTTINNIVGTMPMDSNDAHGIEGLPPTSPLAFTAAAPARQLQFGARYSF